MSIQESQIFPYARSRQRVGDKIGVKADSFFKINLFIYLFLFIYFWLCWVFVAAHGLSLVAVSRGYSSLRCVGLSLRWLLLLWSMGSRRAGFSNCGTWDQ